MANSFKTELPAQLLCQFHLFSQLPRELQQMVMMENVADPGVHFLKLEDHPGINFENMWVRTRDFPKADPGFDALFDGLMFDVPSSLKPQASRNSNDRSWYMAVREHLSRVMRVDGSILDYVDSVIFLQGVSRLTYDTRLTMLPRTNDLVCIEYVHRNLYNHGFSFSCFYHCEKLREIKRVALRFSHEWTLKSNGRGLCPGCGGYHKHLAGKRVLPRHVYQFLARSFPSLEEVWFIDYRMTPKEAGADHVSLNKACSQSWRSIGMKFYAADEKTWDIKPAVSHMIGWIKDCYTRYSSVSRFSDHQSPEKVKFGLIGCREDGGTSAPTG